MPVIFIKDGKSGSSRMALSKIEADQARPIVRNFSSEEVITLLHQPGVPMVIVTVEDGVWVYTGQEALDRLEGR